MKTDTERLKARVDGVMAAFEWLKLDANTYDENDDLHFEWLAGWSSARIEMLKSRGQNVAGLAPMPGLDVGNTLNNQSK